MAECPCAGGQGSCKEKFFDREVDTDLGEEREKVCAIFRGCWVFPVDWWNVSVGEDSGRWYEKGIGPMKTEGIIETSYLSPVREK